MSSEFGNRLKVSIFGQSHGRAVGVVINGLPAGETIDMDKLQRFMERRRGGKSPLTTPRAEADIPSFLSGLENDRTCGFPLCAVLENNNVRSGDYDQLLDKPRPGHGDYTAHVKYGGAADMRGGGHFSGRLTAPLCVAGGIASQLLEKRGIYLGTHLAQVAGVDDEPFPLMPQRELFEALASKALPVLNDRAGEEMSKAITHAAAEGDSVGGVIECAAIGLPAGLGGPLFSGVEGRLAYALFGIPGLKGLEFGSGFEGSRRRGSENNDPFTITDAGDVSTLSNNCGGILGGITDGMPLVLRAAMKPTPSIAKTQQTISLSQGKNTELSVSGRHDPCIAVRGAVVVEAVTALVLLDMILEDE